MAGPYLARKSPISAALLCLYLCVCACDVDNAGSPPARGTLYFPVALALSRHQAPDAPRYLFVVNSNFDLKYSRGSLQALSLEALQEVIESKGCESKRDPCELELVESKQADDDAPAILEDEVPISSYATSLAASPDGRFLFVPTRTDDSLTYVRLDAEADGDDVLDCGADDVCPQAERGIDPETDKPFRWPSDPGMVLSGNVRDWLDDDASDDDRQYALVGHRDGAVSLFVENDDGFLYTSTSQISASNLTGIGYDDNTRYVYLTREADGFGRRLYRLGLVFSERDVEGVGSYAFPADAVTLQGVDPTEDTRAITFLPGIADGSAALRGNRALVVTQRPSALLLADLAGQTGDPLLATVKRITEVGGGASKLSVARVAVTVDGVSTERLLAVVSCYGSRQIFVIDLATMQAIAVVPNLSGPFEVAIDEARGWLYVADFKTSVLRVLDLKPAVFGAQDTVRVIATIGEPKIVQELR